MAEIICRVYNEQTIQFEIHDSLLKAVEEYSDKYAKSINASIQDLIVTGLTFKKINIKH